MIQFQTLENTDISKLTVVFNEAFADYFVPFHVTEQQLKSKFEAENIALNFSVGAFENNNLVGFIFHCFEVRDTKKIIYNNGTGVIKEFRGKGLTTKMYDFILPKIKKENIAVIEMEVMKQNFQAIKSYEKVGFKQTRELACFKGKINLNNLVNEIILKPMQSYNWTEMSAFWDFSPTWQNSIRTAETLINTNFSIGAYSNEKLLGYVIFNPNTKRIQQIAVKKTHRKKGIGKQLILEIVKNFDNEIAIINVDAQYIETTNFFEKMGLENYVIQMEMKYILLSYGKSNNTIL